MATPCIQTVEWMGLVSDLWVKTQWCLAVSCFQMPWLCGDATMMEMIEKKRILCREIKARQRPEKNLCKQDSMPILPSWKRKQPPPYSAPPTATAAGQSTTVFWDTAIWKPTQHRRKHITHQHRNNDDDDDDDDTASGHAHHTVWLTVSADSSLLSINWVSKVWSS